MTGRSRLSPEWAGAARADPFLNPGLGIVSSLCHEPRVALAVLEEMLAPHRPDRRIEVLLRHRPVSASTEGDRVEAVAFLDETGGEERVISAAYVLDATELGDLLALAGVEHVVGAESQKHTGELHALPGEPEPLDQQAISWCFALDHLPGEDHTIARPDDYDFWRGYRADFWPGPQLGWVDCYPHTLEPRRRAIFEDPPLWEGRDGSDLWHFRRIFCRTHYPDGLYPSDITLVNWPQFDYGLGPIVGVSEEERRRHLRGARGLRRSHARPRRRSRRGDRRRGPGARARRADPLERCERAARAPRAARGTHRGRASVAAQRCGRQWSACDGLGCVTGCDGF